MAWTSPRTWVAGNALTAAQLNVDVRDNTNALSGHGHTGAAGDGALAINPAGIVLKTTAETRSSTTLTSDNAFKLTIAGNASEIWAVDIHAMLSHGATMGMVYKWDVPTSGTVLGVGKLHQNGSGAVKSIYVAGTATAELLAQAGSTRNFFDWHGVLYAQGTSGEFKFLWAESVADATGITMASGSYMTKNRLQ